MFSLLALGAAVQARSGGYVQSCDNIYITEIRPADREGVPGYYLNADCGEGNGFGTFADILLGSCIGNINGNLVYLPGSESPYSILFHTTCLYISLNCGANLA